MMPFYIIGGYLHFLIEVMFFGMLLFCSSNKKKKKVPNRGVVSAKDNDLGITTNDSEPTLNVGPRPEHSERRSEQTQPLTAKPSLHMLTARPTNRPLQPRKMVSKTEEDRTHGRKTGQSGTRKPRDDETVIEEKTDWGTPKRVDLGIDIEKEVSIKNTQSWFEGEKARSMQNGAKVERGKSYRDREIGKTMNFKISERRRLNETGRRIFENKEQKTQLSENNDGRTPEKQKSALKSLLEEKKTQTSKLISNREDTKKKPPERNSALRSTRDNKNTEKPEVQKSSLKSLIEEKKTQSAGKSVMSRIEARKSTVFVGETKKQTTERKGALKSLTAEEKEKRAESKPKEKQTQGEQPFSTTVDPKKRKKLGIASAIKVSPMKEARGGLEMTSLQMTQRSSIMSRSLMGSTQESKMELTSEGKQLKQKSKFTKVKKNEAVK